MKVDTDANQALAQQLTHPVVANCLRIQGRPSARWVHGCLPESQLREFVDRLVSETGGVGIAEMCLPKPRKRFEADDLQGAAEIYATILQEDQQNPDALAGLARCYLKSGDTDRAEQTIGLVPPNAQAERLPYSRSSPHWRSRARPPMHCADRRPRSKLAADPKDLPARYDLAVALAANGDKSGGARSPDGNRPAKRDWNEEAARKQLVELFDAWGVKDPPVSRAASGSPQFCSPEDRKAAAAAETP